MLSNDHSYNLIMYSLFQQLGIAAAANIGAIASGITLGFSAVALPAMQNVTPEQASWIGE